MQCSVGVLMGYSKQGMSQTSNNHLYVHNDSRDTVDSNKLQVCHCQLLVPLQPQLVSLLECNRFVQILRHSRFDRHSQDSLQSHDAYKLSSHVALIY